MQISKQWRSHLVRIGSLGGKAAEHKPLTTDQVRALNKERWKMYRHAAQFNAGVPCEWTESNGKIYHGTVLGRKYSKAVVQYEGSEDTLLIHTRILRVRKV